MEKQETLRVAIFDSYTLQSARDIAIFEAMVGAGLRVGEILDLQVGNLVIRDRDTRDNFSYIVVREGKGSKRRTVPMSKAVKSVFVNYLHGIDRSRQGGQDCWGGLLATISVV